MPRQPSAVMNFGRRFWVLAALSLGPAVSTSFARFAYALILPAMRSDLGLNYSQAGSLNTANALGYLVGALLCTRYVPRLGNRRLFSVGMVVTVLALVGSGLAQGFGAQIGFRAIAGVTAAMVYICGAVLASNLFPDRPHLSSSAIAVYFGGAGAGIVLSGVGVPGLLATEGDSAWRTAWLAIGGMSVLFAIASIWASRRIAEASTGATAKPWPRPSTRRSVFAILLTVLDMAFPSQRANGACRRSCAKSSDPCDLRRQHSQFGLLFRNLHKTA